MPREYARGSGRRFVVGHSLRATALVECVGRKRCAAETDVRKRPSDSLHGQTSPLCRLRRHRRDHGGIRRRLLKKRCRDSALRSQTRPCLLTPRSKTPQSRLRRASETWLALRLNARQDIRHLRWRCDGGRLALMGREEQRAALRQPSDAVYGGSGLPHCLGRFTACGFPAHPAVHPPEPAAPTDCPLPTTAD